MLLFLTDYYYCIIFFTGCIRNIQVGGRTWEAPVKVVDALPCSEQVENGVFFNGGFIKVNSTD